jgi:TetR/AcrR family transcriptional regulator, cholesterol catabolism regulator
LQRWASRVGALAYVNRKDLPANVSTEVLCGRILERHRDAIRVQKSHIAVANLARIIEATLKLSNKQGFQATTLRDLAKTSGLSMGGLYTYFSGKPMLLSMILREVASTVTEVLSEPPPGVAMDPGLHLRWLIETHIRLTEAMQPWFVFAYMEAKAFPPSERKIAIDSEALTESIIARVLEQGVKARLFSLSDVGLTASLIKPLLQDWYVKRAKYRKRGISIDSYIAAVIDFVTAAIEAKAGAPSVSFDVA